MTKETSSVFNQKLKSKLSNSIKKNKLDIINDSLCSYFAGLDIDSIKIICDSIISNFLLNKNKIIKKSLNNLVQIYKNKTMKNLRIYLSIWKKSNINISNSKEISLDFIKMFNNLSNSFHMNKKSKNDNNYSPTGKLHQTYSFSSLSSELNLFNNDQEILNDRPQKKQTNKEITRKIEATTPKNLKVFNSKLGISSIKPLTITTNKSKKKTSINQKRAEYKYKKMQIKRNESKDYRNIPSALSGEKSTKIPKKISLIKKCGKNLSKSKINIENIINSNGQNNKNSSCYFDKINNCNNSNKNNKYCYLLNEKNNIMSSISGSISNNKNFKFNKFSVAKI